MHKLYTDNNLLVLRDGITDATIDLVYLDPPFNSNAAYSLLNDEADTAPRAFDDVWRWNDAAQADFELALHSNHANVPDAIAGLRQILGESPMLAYLSMMAPRLVELHRVLKPTGSIYLHCDGAAVHYLKVLMDALFAPPGGFLNHIVWLYGLGGSSKRYWPRKHDDILFYAKAIGDHYFEAARVPATSQRMKGQDKKCPDYWDIPSLNNMARERTGYPTQKPLALLERIIAASCPEGGTVLDPFCGSGTTLVAAQRLGRKWIGIDASEVAMETTTGRLRKACGLYPHHGFELIENADVSRSTPLEH